MPDIVERTAREAGSPPDWFGRALANPGRSHFVTVDGTPVHYLSWGLEVASKPTLLLLHGFRAHARWWDFIAPFFAAEYRVVALDFSGMGDSGHRATYGPMTFVRDIAAVIEDAGLAPATIVAHSFGGGRALRACAELPALIRHAVIVDSYVQFYEEPLPESRALRLTVPPEPDLATALRRFRLMPEQPEALPFLVDHIARHSLRRVEGGWSWKFDRAMPQKITESGGQDILARIGIPVDIVSGEDSAVVSVERAQRIVDHLRFGRGPVCIPEGRHHIMLTQPLALVATLRALLADRRDPTAINRRPEEAAALGSQP